MGFTALARWVNADADAFAKVEYNIKVNHNGIPVSKWYMSIKSYRSTFGMTSNSQDGPSSMPSGNERTMATVTMGENVFVLLEDPLAPTHTDAEMMKMPGPLTHYRSTFLTVKPVGNLEQLLVQLKAQWMPVRVTTARSQNQGGTSSSASNLLAAAELIVDGKIYAIGSDWLVRVGLVRSKDLIRGMVLEGEYLPLPVIRSANPDDPSELVSNLLASLLPNPVGANIVAVTISDAQWNDVLWNREDEEREKAEAKAAKAGAKKGLENMNEDKDPEDDEDVYAYGVHDTQTVTKRDWIGAERDRRSAYLVLGALKTENVL
ncbi:hypothetical protein FA15DRAFT_761406 [Coprinopsis marcescibilis]|uniref:Mediator complex subunit 20 n=1 Tax=Coprinopsis marcescibilis TaxID=230819 RepID=A0A5C3K8T2_COPMA|nr:hypothetical protein FA15DRAFT_761406 [Coprinopsis marcescibilis]